MTTHDVTINLTDHGASGSVTIDGKPVRIRGLAVEGTGVTVEGRYDCPVRVTLDLAVHNVSTHGEGLEVLIPEHTADTLRTLGWTPPAAVDGGALDGDAFEQLLRDVYRTTVCPEPYTAALVAEAGRARAEAARLRGALEDARGELTEQQRNHDQLVEAVCAHIPEEYDGEDSADAIVMRWAEDATAKAARLDEHLATVHKFIDERRRFVHTLRQYSTEDMADYHRWTGHAEARRTLAQDLGLALDDKHGGLKTTEETPDA